MAVCILYLRIPRWLLFSPETISGNVDKRSDMLAAAGTWQLRAWGKGDGDGKGGVALSSILNSRLGLSSQHQPLFSFDTCRQERATWETGLPLS